jgi:glutaredoxin-related protein
MHVHVTYHASHQINYDVIEVIDSAASDQNLKVKELLHIMERKPQMNEQLGSQSKYEIETLIVTKYTQFK